MNTLRVFSTTLVVAAFTFTYQLIAVETRALAQDEATDENAPMDDMGTTTDPDTGTTYGDEDNTAPTDAEMKDKAPTGKAAEAVKTVTGGGREQARAVQEALNANGSAVKVDGVMGKETSGALREYQRKSGLKETGKADTETLKALGIK